jgi:2-polyprenyl-6-hydroxyphenyl methylase/3-demethylubiquinone-9 3-methyltransferase
VADARPSDRSLFDQEIEQGARFRFGANWARFLTVLDQERIAEAERSLRTMLDTDRLDGCRFLDAGSGSGLFSLAARRLGASVQSFDFDPQSVACTRELRRRFTSDDPAWRVDEGSVLDPGFLRGLGQFDVVYSWGVLHHTGAMWQAMDNVIASIAPGGRLFIAIYNDQGRASRWWRRVKKLYCSGIVGRTLVLVVFLTYFIGYGLLSDLVHLRNPLTRYRDYRRNRGMSRIHDWVDWIGGYPFEVATPDAVSSFCGARGLALDRSDLSTGRGINQYVFTLKSGSGSAQGERHG